ncbi:MAG TPA: hypothetical protein VH309_13385 [Elusimicrobiota bacterium]|jgi:hypothetical protein|nr:hypothetical protein [Elusimicrobiota bacterium]
MSAWLLAALLCAPASAAVVETGGEAASAAPVSGAAGAAMGAGASISPISAVPGASLLAPSLNPAAAIQAFPSRAAGTLPAGAVRFAPAPLPALPAAAAASAAPPVSAAPGAANTEGFADDGAASSRGLVPPSGAASAAAPRAIAPGRGLDEAARGLAAPPIEAGGLEPVSAEDAAALGRRVFDRAGDRARLADGSAAGAPGASSLAVSAGAPRSARRDPLLAASGGGSAEDGALRDAVASPMPYAAAPGAALSFFRVPGSPLSSPRSAAGPASPAAPLTFERLSLELGSGLVVKVRAALGLAPALVAAAPSPLLAAAARLSGAAALAGPRRPRAPITSTEWLERRGLLESLSVSEAAASQEAAALAATAAAAPSAFARAEPGLVSPAARRALVPALVLDPTRPARVPALAWWALAFLPAGFVLLKELL